jgi:hypothetical protein
MEGVFGQFPNRRAAVGVMLFVRVSEVRKLWPMIDSYIIKHVVSTQTLEKWEIAGRSGCDDSQARSYFNVSKCSHCKNEKEFSQFRKLNS